MAAPKTHSINQLTPKSLAILKCSDWNIRPIRQAGFDSHSPGQATCPHHELGRATEMQSQSLGVTERSGGIRNRLRLGPGLAVAAVIAALGSRFFLIIWKYSINVFSTISGATSPHSSAISQASPNSFSGSTASTSRELA